MKFNFQNQTESRGAWENVLEKSLDHWISQFELWSRSAIHDWIMFWMNGSAPFYFLFCLLMSLNSPCAVAGDGGEQYIGPIMAWHVRFFNTFYSSVSFFGWYGLVGLKNLQPNLIDRLGSFCLWMFAQLFNFHYLINYCNIY